MAREYRRFRLDNGLRVVCVPDAGSPLVTTAVHYDVGWRAETARQCGFAHLFEHLMFEGSPSLPRGRYGELISAAGGAFSAFTRADYTAYWSQVPVHHAGISLSCEADRMRGLTAGAEALANQVSVVKEEIRVNVRNQPYGSFPFFDLPPVLFSSFANTHDGYGDFAELERSSLADVADFFAQWYAPGNAVVTVTGGLPATELEQLVRDGFEGLPARPAPSQPSRDEPAAGEDRWSVRPDRHAPLPALAIGFRVPDPLGDPDGYVACYLLDRLLTAGESSRLHERLVRRDRSASSVVGWFGLVDQPFGTRHPSLDSLVAYLAPGAHVGQVVAAVEDELRRIAAEGVTEQELHELAAGERVRYWSRLDPQVMRAIELGMHEVVNGSAEQLDVLPARFAEVTGAALRQAAERALRPGRAFVECRPEAGT